MEQTSEKLKLLLQHQIKKIPSLKRFCLFLTLNTFYKLQLCRKRKTVTNLYFHELSTVVSDQIYEQLTIIDLKE